MQQICKLGRAISGTRGLARKRPIYVSHRCVTGFTVGALLENIWFFDEKVEGTSLCHFRGEVNYVSQGSF